MAAENKSRASFILEYWPLITLFAVCILAYAVDQVTISTGSYLLIPYMMVPAEITSSWQDLLSGVFDWGQLNEFSTLLSYAFLHAHAEHIVMNLVFIWVFGSLALRELGPSWFFITFILTTISGGIGQVLIDPQSEIPTLGASGALLGFEGIYLGMALNWRMPDPDVWPLSRPVTPERLMAFAIIGVIMDITGIFGNSSGVAYGAHLGGFISGTILGTTLIPRPRHAL